MGQTAPIQPPHGRAGRKPATILAHGRKPVRNGMRTSIRAASPMQSKPTGIRPWVANAPPPFCALDPNGGAGANQQQTNSKPTANQPTGAQTQSPVRGKAQCAPKLARPGQAPTQSPRTGGAWKGAKRGGRLSLFIVLSFPVTFLFPNSNLYADR